MSKLSKVIKIKSISFNYILQHHSRCPGARAILVSKIHEIPYRKRVRAPWIRTPFSRKYIVVIA